MVDVKDNVLIPVLFVVGALLGYYFGYWLGFGDFLILPYLINVMLYMLLVRFW